MRKLCWGRISNAKNISDFTDKIKLITEIGKEKNIIILYIIIYQKILILLFTNPIRIIRQLLKQDL